MSRGRQSITSRGSRCRCMRKLAPKTTSICSTTAYRLPTSRTSEHANPSLPRLQGRGQIFGAADIPSMIQMLNFLSVRGVNASPRLIEWVCSASIALLALVFVSPVVAEKGKLRERLTPEVMAVVFPGGAERLGPEEGSPPAIAVYKGDKAVAYVFSTLDIIAAPGYSTTPFDVIAGVDLAGHITGAKVVFHDEPHIAGDRVRQGELDRFLAAMAGRALKGGKDAITPDYVADSTVSARAMRTAVLATASLVLRS